MQTPSSRTSILILITYIMWFVSQHGNVMFQHLAPPSFPQMAMRMLHWFQWDSSPALRITFWLVLYHPSISKASSYHSPTGISWGWKVHIWFKFECLPLHAIPRLCWWSLCMPHGLFLLFWLLGIANSIQLMNEENIYGICNVQCMQLSLNPEK